MMEPMSHDRADASAVRARVPVTAVVVTRGATDYLEATLAALGSQRRQPQRVLVVDAARGDGEVAPEVAALAAALPVPVTLVATPGVRTFGGAVRAALAATESEDEGGRGGDRAAGWLWLLHDDSAPEPDALAALLLAVERAPSVAVAGCKQRTWDAPERVVEAGVSTSRFGRRMTGIDAPEVDQGQHDARDDVLGVGIAGALVRRDVWDDLGGPDPSLGPYGDGLDLSRRARLAGHRVVIVPEAVVRHAQASVVGGRPDWDARRSAQGRREAFLHSQLVAAPAAAVPLVAVLAVLSSVVRALGRLVTKEPNLVVAELAAPWAALSRVGRIARARRRAAATRQLPRRTLRPLQATWRDVVGQLRDRRLSAAALRQARQAPSELELRELAAVRRRRRTALAGVLVAAVALSAVLVGRWVVDLLGGDRLVGGSLLVGDADAGELWRLGTSWWAGGGHGAAAAPDPLWLALLPFTVLTGSVGSAAALLLLTAVVLAAVGAWFAAGAATRSRALRAWAAGVWVSAPALLVSLDQVRLGAVVAHAVLPWVVLGVARGIGVARVDVVASGLVGAARLAPRAPERAEDSAEDSAEDTAQDHEAADAAESAAAAKAADASSATPEAERTSDTDAPPDAETVWQSSAAAEPSLSAAAGAALAFVLLTAAAPILLPAGIVVLLLVAPAARRRGRLLWLPVPALALHGPMIVGALTTAGGWRALVAEPGAALPSDPAPAWQQLLGWPEAPAAMAGPWPIGVAEILPLVATGVVVALAVPALLLRPPRVRAARLGWLTAIVGLATALVATRVVVAAAGTTTVASAAPGLSLALVGLLTAALIGAGGVRQALARHVFGWRQVLAAAVALVALVAPASLLGTALAERDVQLTTVSGPVVPAVGRQLQDSAGLRVLVLEPAPAGDDGPAVIATVLRHDGRQLTETSRLVTAVAADEALSDGASGDATTDPGPEDAADPAAPSDPLTQTDPTAQIAAVAARLFAGATDDVSAELDALGVGAVLVPPGADSDRGDLAGRLDSTPGLERVTATEAGTIWRSGGLGAGTAGWARIIGGGGLDGAVEAALPAGHGGTLTETVEPGDAGRLLVLAERADAGWHATLDGRSLRAVESGWQQAFELGPDGGDLVVSHEPAMRTPWLVLQGAVLLVTVLLALPWRRRG